MNESAQPHPTAPQRPFAAEPAATPGGCGKPMLIGCGVLAILLGIGAVVFVVKAKSLLAFALGKLQAEVVAHLPDEIDDAERARLEAAFDATLERIRSGAIDAEALQRLQARLVAAAESAAKDELARDDVLALTRALEAFAGIESPEGAPDPEELEPSGPPPPAPSDQAGEPASRPLAA